MWPAIWGKYGDGTRGYHPLVCHLVDVLAVAESIWGDILPARTRAWVARDLGLDEDAAGRWVAALAGLHDLGKASPAFQLGTLPDPDGSHRAMLKRGGLDPSGDISRARHDLLTAYALPGLLQRHAIDRPLAAAFGVLSGGHHGVFPAATDIIAIGPGSAGGPAWGDARAELADVVDHVAGLDGLAPPTTRTSRASMLVAGLVSVADWIGSNVDLFPYEVPAGTDPPASIDVDTYAAGARGRADAALDRLGWRALPREAGPIGFEAMFGVAPRPLQEVAERLAYEFQEPGIVVIEAPMGEGKTEAALFLADRWSAATGARGAYVALPTQATSDQMFQRVRNALRRRYPDQTIVLQLLHGHAALSAEFEELRRTGDQLFAATDVDPDDPTRPGAVVASTWFTARKRGLLAPFGVGTVDQALLAALVTRHVFVRLFGLAGRVVIVDEVHAYDTYVSTLIERLVEWLAALDSSVVVLSATLPTAKRSALLAAYAKGAGLMPPAVPDDLYPRVAWLSAPRSGSLALEASDASRRSLGIAWVRSRADGAMEEDELDALVGLVAEGGCAAVVCNTVDRAQATFLRLRGRLPGLASDGLPLVDLLHARFPFAERAEREARVIRRFGPGDGSKRPNSKRPERAVLVATQVIEQSLDLDFDAMWTDFAPIDLLLQRSGRLHRHRSNDGRRGTALAAPVLRIVGPSDTMDGEPVLDRGTAAVYDDAHVRLRSWLALAGRHAIRVPDEVGDLVEAVYADRDAPVDLPRNVREAWHRTRESSRRAAEADAVEARDRWVRSPSDAGATVTELTRNAADDDPDAGSFRALTRLDADGQLVVCLEAGPGGPHLDGRRVDLAAPPSVADARVLLMHSLRLSQRGLLRTLRSAPVPAGWRRSSLLGGARPLVFDAKGVLDIDEAGGRGTWRLVLDRDLGLVSEHRASGGSP